MSRLTASEILEAIRRRHVDYGCVFIPEMYFGVNLKRQTRRIDAWAFDITTPFKRTSYEIKVSRSDFMKEVKTPEKRKLALLYSDYYYFVTPKGLVDIGEVPVDTGLIEVVTACDGVNYAHVKLEAPQHECYPPNWKFVAAVFKRCVEYEEDLKDQVLCAQRLSPLRLEQEGVNGAPH